MVKKRKKYTKGRCQVCEEKDGIKVTLHRQRERHGEQGKDKPNEFSICPVCRAIYKRTGNGGKKATFKLVYNPYKDVNTSTPQEEDHK